MVNLKTVDLSTLKYDGFIDISVGSGRKCRKWKNQRPAWSTLLKKKFSKPKVTNETYAEFLHMSKAAQDDIKDVGGFVGGEVLNGRRIAENVSSRQLVTLDADFAPYDFWGEIALMLANACCIYSTHKHSETTPRYRLVIPLDRPVSPDEYQAISRKIAESINIEYFDDTTYQAHRLMYYPSVSKDGEYIFMYQDGPWLSADEVLNQYDNWEDQSTWPVSSRTTQRIKRTVDKQEDPLEKSGLVGAFCRTYTIREVIDKFLPDVYKPCDSANRYTYAGGSSYGGAVIYDDKFLYSHHATDPTSMKLCNAFDLVRIHKFGGLDSNTRIEDVQKLPSFIKMCELASTDTQTKLEQTRERFREIGRDFNDLDEEADTAWVSLLQSHPKTGKILTTRANIELIMNNDPAVKGSFGYEMFSQRIAVLKPPGWRTTDSNETYWTDTDEAHLRELLETSYEIDSRSRIDDCILTVANDKKFHVVRNFLRQLEWDGIERLNTLLVDYLGAEDNMYTQAVTRKTLVAAVARVMQPGIKFDTMLVLVGRQGLGKSYLLKKLGGRWFSDSITSLQGKEAFEQLRGVWIEEMSELSAMRKMDIETIKQYITKQVDTYRPPYGKGLQDFPRQCVFIGTTNSENFLRDRTGNRRFLPVRVGVQKPKLSLFAEGVDDYIRQVWAEAVHYYDNGESLILEKEAQEQAKLAQKKHMEENPLEGSLGAYLDMKVPANWYELDVRARREFVRGEGYNVDMDGCFTREKICTLEIWCELLNGDIKNFSNFDRREIRETLDTLEGWERYSVGRGRLKFGKYYGAQMAWVRIRERLL